jgi:hypothetical protein
MTGLDRRSEISDLRYFPFHRAVEWTRITPKTKIQTADVPVDLPRASDRFELGIVMFPIVGLGSRAGID